MSPFSEQNKQLTKRRGSGWFREEQKLEKWFRGPTWEGPGEKGHSKTQVPVPFQLFVESYNFRPLHVMIDLGYYKYLPPF